MDGGACGNRCRKRTQDLRRRGAVLLDGSDGGRQQWPKAPSGGANAPGVCRRVSSFEVLPAIQRDRCWERRKTGMRSVYSGWTGQGACGGSAGDALDALLAARLCLRPARRGCPHPAPNLDRCRCRNRLRNRCGVALSPTGDLLVERSITTTTTTTRNLTHLQAFRALEQSGRGQGQVTVERHCGRQMILRFHAGRVIIDVTGRSRWHAPR